MNVWFYKEDTTVIFAIIQASKLGPLGGVSKHLRFKDKVLGVLPQGIRLCKGFRIWGLRPSASKGTHNLACYYRSVHLGDPIPY